MFHVWTGTQPTVASSGERFGGVDPGHQSHTEKDPVYPTSFHKREINGGLQPFVGKVGKVFGQTFLPVAVIKEC